MVDFCYVFFFKQKTAYEMRISDWSSDVCSSDLQELRVRLRALGKGAAEGTCAGGLVVGAAVEAGGQRARGGLQRREQQGAGAGHHEVAAAVGIGGEAAVAAVRRREGRREAARLPAHLTAQLAVPRLARQIGRAHV